MLGLTISRGLSAAGRLRALPQKLRQTQILTMERAVRLTENDLKKNSLTGHKGHDAFWGVTGAAGQELGSRTGHTRRSIRTSVFVGLGGKSVTGTIGSPLPQMRLHEEGGTVSGKPWLRIPTRVMQTASGVDRLAGRSARSLPNTAVITSRSGNPWIVEVGTPRSRLAQEAQGFPLMLYMLKRDVRLRARRPFRRSLDRVRPRLRAMFGAGFSAVVRSP